jgi:hypothetical protein
VLLARFGDNLSFAGVLFCVEDFVFDAVFFGKGLREGFALFDTYCSD